MTDRFYSFRIVTYYTRQENIQPLLDQAFKYAWILHDKDDTDPHIHILCTFKQNKTFTAVKKLCVPMEGEKEQNTFAYRLEDKYEDYIYLDHRNQPDKHRYPEEEIHCNDKKYFLGNIQKSIDNAELISDLLRLVGGEISLREMAIKYGKDFIKNRDTYISFAREVMLEDVVEENKAIMAQKLEEERRKPRQLELIDDDIEVPFDV